MYNVLVVLGAICGFFTIVLLGVAVDQATTEKRRAVRMLETQVAGANPSGQTINMRDTQMSENFGKRVLVPVISAAGRFSRRVTPIDARDRLANKIVLAGSPPGWDAERILAFKIIGAGAGVVGGFFIVNMAHLTSFMQVLCVGLLTFAGFVLPDSRVNRRVAERQKEILGTLSDTLDLLTISVEAGLALNAAIAQVVQNVPGVLSSEFARMLQEIQLGVPRSDAFRHLADRTDVDALNAFALAMIQADVFGVSISSVLRTQAQQQRIKRRQHIEAKAQQTPVKIVFPLILCILPSLFIVIIGPGAINIYHSFVHLR
jgi:tight adherence protein C